MTKSADTSPLEPRNGRIYDTPLLQQMMDLPPVRSGHDAVAYSLAHLAQRHGFDHLCRSCGKQVRSFNPDCKGCAPPFPSRKAPSRRGVHPFVSSRVPVAFRGHALRPRTTTEAIAVLGEISAQLAAGIVSGHVARVMILAVRVQCRILMEQEAKLFHLTERKEIELIRHRLQGRAATIAQKKKIAILEKKKEASIAAAQARAAAKKNRGGKAPHEVPSLQVTDVERRLAEGEKE